MLQVLGEMFPEAPIFTLLYDKKKLGKIFPVERVRTSFLQRAPDFLRKRQKYLLPWMSTAVESFDLSNYDLVISSSNSFAHGVITNTFTKHLCYCHSPMRYAWDWTHEYIKEQKMGRLKQWMARKIIHDLRIWDKAASDRVTRYIANSENVKKRIQKYYRMDAEVIYPPVEIGRFEVSPKHEDYFLIISALTPFKKIDLAVSAFNKIGRRLLVIGDGAQKNFLKSLAGPKVDILGWKSDEEVREYLKNCRALIFPGEEDFGITPVEAMACGKPVIAYGKGGVTESVIEGKTGVFFAEPTVESLEAALAKFYLQEDKFDPEVIREQAEKFRKENFVAAIKGEVERMME